ncbi:universal stress protein [Nitrosopumilus ureiphilus]|uniref:universal stress protein n=1 Tax=Nitrosopumilus ureiphilus TaxID=1470067 RepID=UPI0015CE1431|nr:universal stress protein [Nitrosopumilus ureiphilus]
MLQNRFKKILVGIDGSVNSIRGLNQAISLARQSQGVITGIHVLPEFPPSYEINLKTYRAQINKVGKKFMDTAKISAARHGIEFNEKIASSKNTVDTIVGFANKNKFDIVIIGSRGLGSPKINYVGSVAHGIVNNSKVPVLIVK